MAIPLTNRKPIPLALAASCILTILIIVGSRNLEHDDAALFGYIVASIVAFGAVVFRYAIWLQRPATRIYWRRGWKLFRDRKNLLANTSSAAKTEDIEDSTDHTEPRRNRSDRNLAGKGRTAVAQARLILLVMINVAQLWVLAATVEAALAHRFSALLPLVIASGVCFVVSLH